MSDAAITTIVTGIITVVGMVIGFLTMWVKLKHAGTKAEEAATKAGIVESKIDDNTDITKSIDAKADTVVQQTNGAMDQMRMVVENVAERVAKLEEYNRNSSHRLIDAINAVHLKVAEMMAMQSRPAVVVTPSVPEVKSQA